MVELSWQHQTGVSHSRMVAEIATQLATVDIDWFKNLQ